MELKLANGEVLIKEWSYSVTGGALQKDNKKLQDKPLEPIEITEKSSSAVDGVEIKDSVPTRVTQVSDSSVLRVTLQDIKNLEERNKNAQSTITRLREEKKALVNQKTLLTQYIQQAKATRENELQASTMQGENEALEGEVAKLRTEAAELSASLTRTK